MPPRSSARSTTSCRTPTCTGRPTDGSSSPSSRPTASSGSASPMRAPGAGPTPPAKPLANAIHDALTGPAPDGISADITFTNNLFPSGSLTGAAGSALLSGATGRLWATNDGRGRLELQSGAGDAQIVWN